MIKPPKAKANTANRAYSAAHFALELDNRKDVGLFRSIEGGGVKADVMTYQYGVHKDNGGHHRWKILGKPKFEDIKLQVGMAMSQPFYDWIRDFFVGKATRKNGSISAADFYYVERARRNFKEAMIKELTFPKLDASDKNAVYMTVALAVEELEFVKGNGQKLEPPKGFEGQKLWTACNFDLTLHGLEDACKRVTKVDSFTVKQATTEYHMGGRKHAVKTPTQMEYPNLTFYVPEADAQPFMDHMKKRVGFVAQGEQRPDVNLHGSVNVRDNEGHNIFSVNFVESDIVSITPDKSDATSEDVKQVKVELYTEKMEFFYPVMELE
jgi:phage tail-like protein